MAEFPKARQVCHGKWDAILANLGAPVVLGKPLQHGPCPACGGKDRFRYDNSRGNGNWFCNHCGSGDGFQLLMGWRGWDFATAAREAMEADGAAPVAPTPQPETDEPDRRRRMNQAWREAHRFDIVRAYLKFRGLGVASTRLRGHPGLYYRDEAHQGRYPAMLALVQGPDGKPRSIHRTYLADVACRKKLMPPIGTVAGGAVRLSAAGPALAVAEGIETALAATQLSGLPAWAALSAGGLRSLVLPPEVQEVVIFADHDRHGVGQAAAYHLAERMEGEGRRTKVLIPPEPGTDWLDELNRG